MIHIAFRPQETLKNSWSLGKFSKINVAGGKEDSVLLPPGFLYGHGHQNEDRLLGGGKKKKSQNLIFPSKICSSVMEKEPDNEVVSSLN